MEQYTPVPVHEVGAETAMIGGAVADLAVASAVAAVALVAVAASAVAASEVALLAVAAQVADGNSIIDGTPYTSLFGKSNLACNWPI